MARCPAHRDRTPSLSISERDGRILVHCHAGCSQEAVIQALKCRGLWDSEDHRTRLIVTTYAYTDDKAGLLYEVVRYEPKDFRPRYPDGRGGWIWKKHPRQVLYHLPEVLAAPMVVVAEGERDADTLRSHGCVATTNAGGANAPWLPQYTDALRGREVVLIPDRDQPGRARVKNIARALLGHAAKILMVELEDGKDATDWFNRGHSELEFIAEVEGPEHDQ